MKFSIITVCFNAEKTIRKAISSVYEQKHKDFEHIIIDGNSSDGTISIIEELKHDKMKIVSEPDEGLYDAMNKGMRLCGGDVICILNSDDYYKNENVLTVVNNCFTSNVDVIFGDVEFVKKQDPTCITRIIRPKKFKPWLMRFGWMPPHTATFLRANVVMNVGEYSLNFQTAADYEYFIRIFYKERYEYKYLSETLVKMQEGGISNSGITSYLKNSWEIVRALKNNGYYTNIFFILLRLPIKFLKEKVLIPK